MFALVATSPLSLLAGPWNSIPQTIEVDGLRVHGAGVGFSGNGKLVVDVVFAGNAPTQFHTLSGQTPNLDGNTLTITRAWNAPTLAQLKTTLKQRLNSDATERWISVRGANAAGIESALSTGNSNIDGAGTINAAISAYQAVTFP